MVSALDVIGAVSEVLGPSIESLVLSTKLCDLLPALCLDNDPEVRQSAFALVGDLASNATLHLRPWLPMVLPLLVANLDGAPVGRLPGISRSAEPPGP